MMSVVSARSGIAVAQLADELEVALARVRAAHRLEDARRARLQRQVRVLADRRALGHRLDHRAAEVLRVRAREADALDPLDRVARAQQLAELGVDVGQQVAAPGVDVLAEQRQLAHALRGEVRDLGEHVAGAAADLAPAHRRDDAVGARRVAAHRDLHPRLERAARGASAASRRTCARRLSPTRRARRRSRRRRATRRGAGSCRARTRRRRPGRA